MNFSHTVQGWKVPEVSHGNTVATVHLGNNGTTLADQISEDRWDINTMLAICLGPLAVVLLISYVIHWFQVLHRIRRNIKTRRLELMELPHNKVSTMMTILTLENERSGIYYDDDNTQDIK